MAHHVLGGRERAKHIDIRKHFAHDSEAVQNRHMCLYQMIQIWTENQLVDILTKGLQLAQFERCLYRLLGESSGVKEGLRDLGL
jgi:hypothetical protein